MNWFEKMCRQTGLMMHHIVKPPPPPPEDRPQKREVRRTVEEEQVSPSVTLRRTTIEEIELKPGRHDKNQDV